MRHIFLFPVKALIVHKLTNRQLWVRGHYVNMTYCERKKEPMGRPEYFVMSCQDMVEQMLCAEYVEQTYIILEKEKA